MNISHEANECARAITALVELSTGKPLPIEACMKIVVCVQIAINESSKPKRTKTKKP